MTENCKVVRHNVSKRTVTVTTHNAQQIDTRERQPAGLRHGYIGGEEGVLEGVANDPSNSIARSVSNPQAPTVSPGDTNLHAKGVSGRIIIQSEATDLKAILDALIDAISSMNTTGSPANHVVAPDTRATLLQIKTNLATLLKEKT